MNVTIRNYRYQEDILYCPAKHVMWAAGRQTGKTWGAVNWIVENLLEKKDTGLWIDTKHTNIDKYVDRYFKPLLKDAWNLCNWNQQKKILTLPNQSTIDFGSAERPELLEGFNYAYVVLNEAGIILKKPDLWYITVQPMCKRAQVRFIGTPKGKNLFHQLYIRGKGDDSEYKSFYLSAYDSKEWKKETLDKLKSDIPELAFRQNYLAEFLDDNAGVFRNIQSCVKPDIQLLERGDPARQYVFGVDLAKHQDFTVIFGADVQSKSIIYFERFNQLDWTFQKQKIFDVFTRFNKPKFLLDSTGVGDPIYDDLSRVMEEQLEGFKITSGTKKELIESLVVAIQNTSIYYPSIEALISELELYEYQVTKAGNITYNAPEGFHDDCVIALALVWQLLRPDNNSFGFVF